MLVKSVSSCGVRCVPCRARHTRLVVAVKMIMYCRAMLRTSADRPTGCYETSVSIYQIKRRLISEDSTQYRLRLSENMVQSGILRRRSKEVLVE